MTLKEAIKILETAGIEECVFDAKEIFSSIGGVPKYKLINTNYETSDKKTIEAIFRRAKREPLGYILGEVGFYNEVYKVNPGVLIPRPDTETLVDYAVKNLPTKACFLDLCTGSGCVAISTLKNTHGTSALAVDISDEALKVAKENSELNKVADRISFIKSDVFAFLPSEKFDAILSNPPYISENVYKSLQIEIFFEPEIAFVGGDDGLKFYKEIIKKFKNNLKDDAFFAFEIGYDQAENLIKIADENGFACEMIKDLSFNDRVAVLRKNKKQPCEKQSKNA